MSTNRLGLIRRIHTSVNFRVLIAPLPQAPVGEVTPGCHPDVRRSRGAGADPRAGRDAGASKGRCDSGDLPRNCLASPAIANRVAVGIHAPGLSRASFAGCHPAPGPDESFRCWLASRFAVGNVRWIQGMVSGRVGPSGPPRPSGERVMVMARGTSPAGYSTAAVSTLTGINCHSLRVWERRYGFPVPHRSASGHRRYALDQVGVLRRIAALAQDGHPIGALIDDHRAGRIQLDAARPGPAAERSPASLVVDLLVVGDLVGAGAILRPVHPARAARGADRAGAGGDRRAVVPRRERGLPGFAGDRLALPAPQPAAGPGPAGQLQPEAR